MKITKETITLVLGIISIVGIIVLLLLNNPKTDSSKDYQEIRSAMDRIEKRQAMDLIYKARIDSLNGEVIKRDNEILNYQKQITTIYKKYNEKVTYINNLSSDELLRYYTKQLPSDTSR
jgi:predicted RNase H-like nuclease (RuvC/YqgF family)